MKQLRLTILISMIMAVGGILPSAFSQDDAEKPAAASEESFYDSMSLSGTLHSTYQFRNYDGLDDHDIYEYLSLRLDDIVKDRMDAAFSMYWHEDLNSGSPLRPGDNYDPFLDIDQSDSNNRFRFFTGYVDIKDLGFDESRLRLGRQYMEEIDHVHFDGASYYFKPLDRLSVTVFGGVPVAFYSATSGDEIYGTHLEYVFTPKTKAALEYYRYDANGYNDDLAKVEVWHRFTDDLIVHQDMSLLDADPYIMQSDLYYRMDGWDLDINAQLVRLWEDVRDQTINFNPVFPILNGYEPFTYGSIFATKGMGKYWSLIGGFDFRVVDDSSNPVNAFTNRDYRRFSAGVEVYPIERVTVSVSGEFWDVDDGDQFSGITGEVEYEPCKDWTVSAGVDYGEYVQEYRDEFLFLNGVNDVFRITPDVLTYYGRVRWKPTDKIYSAATVEIEDSDFENDNWYAVRLEVGVNF